MLNIIFGDVENCIYNTEVYFRNTFDDEWITSDIVKQIIKDIDKSEVINARCIESPVLGQITPEMLSGGTKTLILLMNDDSKIFNASTCGDNCAKWILKIAQQKDITIRLGHVMKFDEPFEVRIVNSNQVVSTMKDFIIQAHEYN